MRRFSLCLVSVSVISLLFAICLQAQEIRSQDVPKMRGIETPPVQRPFEALSPQEIFKRASPSVMVVESLDAKGSVAAYGSGVVIATGRVVTNRHVIESGASFRVEHAGIGQVGAGVLKAQLVPLKKAFERLAETLTKK